MGDVSIGLPEAETGNWAPENEQSTSFEVILIRALAELWRHRSMIAMVTAASIVLGVLYAIALPTEYTAATKILTPQPTQSTASLLVAQLASSGSGPLAAAAESGLGLKNPNEMYVGLLGSRPVADALIRQFGLQEVFHARDLTAAREKLMAATQITTEKSGLLSISYTDRDRERAARVANAYTDQLRSLTKTMAVTEAAQRWLFYEEQLKQARKDLASSELAFQQVQQKKGMVALSEQTRAIIQSIAALRAQITAKQVEVEALRSYSTDRNPSLELAINELNALRAEQMRLEQHSHSPEVAGPGLQDVPSEGLEYLQAEHEAQYRQAVYDMLMKQYDAARLDEAKDAAVIQVVEPAIVPERKSSPHRSLIVIAFAIAGLLGSCVLVRFQWWKKRLQTDAEIAGTLRELSMHSQSNAHA